MGKEKEAIQTENKSRGNKEGQEREKRTFKSILVFVSLYFPPSTLSLNLLLNIHSET